MSKAISVLEPRVADVLHHSSGDDYFVTFCDCGLLISASENWFYSAIHNQDQELIDNSGWWRVKEVPQILLYINFTKGTLISLSLVIQGNNDITYDDNGQKISVLYSSLGGGNCYPIRQYIYLNASMECIVAIPNPGFNYIRIGYIATGVKGGSVVLKALRSWMNTRMIRI